MSQASIEERIRSYPLTSAEFKEWCEQADPAPVIGRFRPVLFVSFYTPKYADEARQLIESLDKFKLWHSVHGLPNEFASWTAACAHEAKFVFDMMIANPNIPIVWLDADARVRQLPELFRSLSSKCDIGAHFLNGKELLSGTLFFAPTDAARWAVDKWMQWCDKSPGVWDQVVLQGVLKRHPEVRIADLPPSYTQIFDSMKHYGQPVIEHMQASRRLKNAKASPVSPESSAPKIESELASIDPQDLADRWG